MFFLVHRTQYFREEKQTGKKSRKQVFILDVGAFGSHNWAVKFGRTRKKLNVVDVR